MTDIFISYAQQDRDQVSVLAGAFQNAGWSVFWDRNIPTGLTWRGYVGKALYEATCVVVAWSESSVESEWVLEEADFGKRKGNLIPVFLQKIDPPFGFGAFQALDLSAWDGKTNARAFEQLVQDMERLLDSRPKPAAKKSPRKRKVARPGVSRQKEKERKAALEAEAKRKEDKRQAQLAAELRQKEEERKARLDAEAKLRSDEQQIRWPGVELRAERRDWQPPAKPADESTPMTATHGGIRGPGDALSHPRQTGAANRTVKRWVIGLSVFGVAVASMLAIRYWPAAVPEPRIEEFLASSTSITQGDTVNLRWATREADTVKLIPQGSVATDGSLSLSPAEDTEYTLIATGPGGRVRKTVRIDVSPAPVVVAMVEAIETDRAVISEVNRTTVMTESSTGQAAVSAVDATALVAEVSAADTAGPIPEVSVADDSSIEVLPVAEAEFSLTGRNQAEEAGGSGASDFSPAAPLPAGNAAGQCAYLDLTHELIFDTLNVGAACGENPTRCLVQMNILSTEYETLPPSCRVMIDQVTEALRSGWGSGEAGCSGTVCCDDTGCRGS